MVIKIEGEGLWHARRHGGPKRRVRRKIHLGIDEASSGVQAVEITGSHTGKALALHDRLSRIPAQEQIGSVKLLGQRLMTSDFDRNVAGLQVRIATLNGCTAPGIPVALLMAWMSSPSVMASTIITLALCDAVRRGHPRHQQSLLTLPSILEKGSHVQTMGSNT